jgi:hypothetical protein
MNFIDQASIMNILKTLLLKNLFIVLYFLLSNRNRLSARI